MLAQVKSGFMWGGSRPTEISFVGANGRSGSGNLSYPAGIAAGDLAVVWDFSMATGSIPTDVTPTGYTAIGSSQSTPGTFVQSRWNMSYKVLTGSETEIDGMASNIGGNTKVVLVLRFSGGGAWDAPASVGQEIAEPFASTVTSKTVTVGAAPLVVLGAIANDADDDLVMSPASDGQFSYSNGNGFWLTAGYKIHNTLPVNNTVDDDVGTMFAVGACYVAVTV